MTKYLMVVLTNAVEGQDQAFNQWYDECHIPDVLAVPGFVAATRYVAEQVQRDDNVPYRYGALYEIDTDDLAASLNALKARAGTDVMPISASMAKERLVTVFTSLK